MLQSLGSQRVRHDLLTEQQLYIYMYVYLYNKYLYNKSVQFIAVFVLPLQRELQDLTEIFDHKESG